MIDALRKLSALCAVFLVVVIGAGITSAFAVDAHYSDGSTHDGQANYGPPPTNPFFAEGQACKLDVIDPPGVVFVTEHFVYGTTPPPAGVVPVTDDASAVFPYHGVAPGLFTVDIESYVADKQGFRADTWNIGTGVTAWVPFDCRVPEETTTTTTLPGEVPHHPPVDDSTTTTSTTVVPSTPTTFTSSTAKIAAAETQLPRTGIGHVAVELVIAAIALSLGALCLVLRVRL